MEKGKGRNGNADSVLLNEEPLSFFFLIIRDFSIIIGFQSIGSGKMNAKSRKDCGSFLLAASTLAFQFSPVFGLSLFRAFAISQ
jgi:hypothetical protein